MENKACLECPARELQKFHRLLEKRLTRRLPKEVQEPLLEAKKQMRQAVRGLICHLLEAEGRSSERCSEGYSEQRPEGYSEGSPDQYSKRRPEQSRGISLE